MSKDVPFKERIKALAGEREYDIQLSEKLKIHIEVLAEYIGHQLTSNIPEISKVDAACRAISVINETLKRIK